MKNRLFKSVKGHKEDIIKFLREMIAIPSESRNEKRVIERIKTEMQKVGFDSVQIDNMGNVIGKIGTGKRIIAMDAHVDTVGTGNLEHWEWDPYKGKVEKGNVYGRGAVDQKAGMAALVYAGKFIRDYNLLSDFTLYITGSVQKEDCDGLAWQYIIEEDNLRPDCVVITEPTNLDVYIGHRGRMDVGVTSFGKTAHAAAPERGENAVYGMSKIIGEIEQLNSKLKDDTFLGKGSIAVTDIKCKSPSLSALPDECYVHMDRRLTQNDDKISALKEIKEVISKTGIKASAEILRYDLPGYRGLKYPAARYFPAWTLPLGHPLLNTAFTTSKEVFGNCNGVGHWVFSTNGVMTMGMYRIPTVGFGPGDEKYSHTNEEHVPIEQILKAIAWYALFPNEYVKIMAEENNI